MIFKLSEERHLKDFKVGIKEQYAARIIFFVAGFGIATWAPMIPLVKDRLNIGADVLGLLILCMGVSSFLMMPIAGLFAQKFGCKKVLRVMGLLMGVEIVCLSMLPNVWLYGVFLFILGAIGGTLNVNMNIHAVIVEKLSKKRMMSSMHALWSVGCFLGASLFSLLAKLGLSATQIAIVHCIIIFAVVIYFSQFFLPYKGSGNEKAIAIPKGIVGLFGILAVISFLGEGGMMDWSGIFLNEAKGVDLSLAGVGYAVFSAAMLVGRLIGDKVVQFLGEQKVVIFGGLVASFGYILAIAIDNFFILQIGFILLGLGAANIVPVVYTLLGKQSVMPINSAVTAVTSIGYLGVMFGPALLGFIAHGIGITAVFCILAGLFIIQSFIARYVFKVLN